MKFIELDYVAKLFNDMLGADFVVGVNCIPYILDGNATPCTLTVTRKPFAVDNLRSETLEIGLTFYVNVDTDDIKMKTLYEIDKLMGTHTGEIEAYEREGESPTVYAYNMYLRGNEPMTDPQFDSGNQCQSYKLSGEMLITDKNGGAVVANDVKTFIDGAEVTILSCQTDANTTSDSLPMLNKTAFQPVVKGQGRCWRVSALFTGSDIDDKLIEEIENSYGKEHVFKRVYSGKELTKSVMLINGAITAQAGAYVQYEAVFQEV